MFYLCGFSKTSFSLLLSKIILYFTGRDEPTKESLGNYLLIYEIFIIIWITFGLGYVLMIILAISDGLRKPASKVAKKLAKAEKVVLEKVLHEVVILKRSRKGHHPVNNPNVSEVGEVSPDGLSFQNDAFKEETLPTSAEDSDVTELFEEMNHDTITSLRHFVDSAMRSKRHSFHYQGSVKSSHESITAASVHGDNTSPASSSASSAKSNWRRLMPRRFSLRSKFSIIVLKVTTGKAHFPCLPVATRVMPQ